MDTNDNIQNNGLGNSESNNDNDDNNTGLTADQKIIQDSVQIPDDVDIKTQEAELVSRDVLKMNQAFELSQYLYKEVLSPELSENEDLKREQKKELMTRLFKILKWQFICTYVFVAIIIILIGTSSFLNISENVIEKMIGFIEFYITSIVGELIAILFFIVKNVFDKSIVELIKDFDKRDDSKKDAK